MADKTPPAPDPLALHPKKTRFTPTDLRAIFGVPKTRYDALVSAGLLLERDYVRSDIDSGVVALYQFLSGNSRITTDSLAKLLGVTGPTVLTRAKRAGIDPSDVQKIRIRSGGSGQRFWWSVSDLKRFVADHSRRHPGATAHTTLEELMAAQATADDARHVERLEAAHAAALRRNEHLQAERERALRREQQAALDAERIQRLTEDVAVTVRSKTSSPSHRVWMHLGPTNSGKTFHAIEHLVKEYRNDPAGRYVYAGPLRMLAHEVRDRIAEMIGPENVGLITGEEQDNPGAPVVCATVEAAPESGRVLIIDEAHWAADHDRGRHWTRLLLDSDFPDTVVLGPSECEPLLRAAFADLPETAVTVTHHRRKTSLTYVGENRAPGDRTAVVAFSRRKVTDITEVLRRRGVPAVPLYGALPLAVRRDHIDQFVSGRARVVVTTDVIGHGVNLPVDHVIFTDTVKFDGTRRRGLHLWEAAQIAGRAGRFGLSEHGTVGYWKFHGSGRNGASDISEKRLREAVEVAAGARSSGLETAKLRVTPNLAALSLDDGDHRYLSVALQLWGARAGETYRNSEVLRPSAMTGVLNNLHAVAHTLGTGIAASPGRFDGKDGDRPWTMSLPELWGLISGPFDPEDRALAAGARWLSTRNDRTVRDAVDAACRITGWDRKDTLEKRVRELLGFRYLGMILDPGGRGDLPGGVSGSWIADTEKLYSTELSDIFDSELAEAEHRAATMTTKRNRKKLVPPRKDSHAGSPR